MSPPTNDPSNGEQPLSFEEALRRLETVVHELEDGEIGLDAALARYEDGIGLLRHCHALLERAERRIEVLSGTDSDGNPVTQPFDETPTAAGGDRAGRSRQRSPPARSGLQRPEPPPESEIDSPPGLF